MSTTASTITRRTVTTRDGVHVPSVIDLPEDVEADVAVECGLTRHVRLIGDPRRPVLAIHDTDGRPILLPAGSVIRCSEPTAANLAACHQAAPCHTDGRVLTEVEQRHLPRHLRCRPTPTFAGPGHPFEPADPHTPCEGDVADYLGLGEDTIRAVRLTQALRLADDTLPAGTVAVMPDSLAVTLLARSHAERADGQDQYDLEREAAAILATGYRETAANARARDDRDHQRLGR